MCQWDLLVVERSEVYIDGVKTTEKLYFRRILAMRWLVFGKKGKMIKFLCSGLGLVLEVFLISLLCRLSMRELR